MSLPISYLRDDFQDNVQAPAWANAIVLGSATKAETGGQARLTLPSSTAGSHLATYASAHRYDLTGDGFVWNIDTMVATGVAATATFDLYNDASSILRWQQLSNAITARKVVAGVDTQLFTATWSSSTYKYLRIRESGGTVFFDSSTNGTSWTNRASIVGLPFVVTDLFVQFSASCGNVASPGSLRLEDVNLILPALSSTWHDTTVEWEREERFRTITLSSSSGQAYIAVASEATSRKANGDPNVLTTPRYFAGPLGSSSGGYNQLTEYATQAAAQAMAINLPLDDRWDLPGDVRCRMIRLYHRSTTGTTYRIDEYYPRRLIQSDDIEAESIKAINISAGAVTADKIFVLQLSAITANIGGLNIDLTGYLWQGTGTAAAPTTGLKIFNSGGVGKLSTYNATVEQITLDTDGKLKWGAGAGIMDAGGVRIIQGASVVDLRSLALVKADGTTVIGRYGGGYATSHGLFIEGTAISGEQSFVDVTARAGTTDGAVTTLRAVSGAAAALITLTSDGTTPTIALSASGGTTVSGAAGGLSVGTTGAGAGQIATSGSVGFGIAAQGNVRAFVKGVDTTSSNFALVVTNSASTGIFAIRNDSRIGFFGVAEVARPTVTGSRGGNAALASLLTALASLGLVVDSST